MTRPAPTIHELLDHASFVRRLAEGLAAGAEADDVVQEVWRAALSHPPRKAGAARAWLARVLDHADAMRRRAGARRRRHEQAAPGPAAALDPAETAARAEAIRRVGDAVASLGEPFRTVIFLRFFDDLAPREIASRLGVPGATVGTRLHRGLQRLRERLGGRRERGRWLPGLAAAAMPGALPEPSHIHLLGALVMSAKTKVTALAVLALVVAGALWWLPHAGEHAHLESASAGSRAAMPGAEPVDAAATSPLKTTPFAEDAEPEATDAHEAKAASVGRLRVHVADETEEPVPAIGVRARAFVNGRFRSLQGVTGSDGSFTFEGLGPAEWVVELDRPAGTSTKAVVKPGETAKAQLHVPAGITVSGEVVDPRGLPVAGAEVLTSHVAVRPQIVWAVARTGSEGRFELGHLSEINLVGARTREHGTSDFVLVRRRAPGVVPIRIQLPDGAGNVAGTVFGPSGDVLPDAQVSVGVVNDGQISAPPPTSVITDAEGRYRVEYLRPGDQPVHAWAPGLASWSGSTAVGGRGRTTTLHIRHWSPLQRSPGPSTTPREDPSETPMSASPSGGRSRRRASNPEPTEGSASKTCRRGRSRSR